MIQLKKHKKRKEANITKRQQQTKTTTQQILHTHTYTHIIIKRFFLLQLPSNLKTQKKIKIYEKNK